MSPEFIQFKFWLSIGLLNAFAISAIGQSTNSVPVESAPSARVSEWLESTRRGNVFWDTYQRQFGIRSSDLAEDRLGRLTELELTEELNSEGYAFYDRLTPRAEHVFASSTLDSAREAFVTTLPFIKGWTDLKESSRLSADFISGSIGNTAEERTPFVAATPSYIALENPWWSNPGQRIQYGIRPWRTTPYAYVRSAIGRIAERPLTIDVRALTHINGDSVFEGNLVFPLTRRWLISGGASLTSPQNVMTRSLRLERTVRRGGRNGRSESVFFAGIQEQNSQFAGVETTVRSLAFGISADW